MRNKNTGYYIKAGLIALIVSPAIVTAGCYAGLLAGDALGIHTDSPAGYSAVIAICALLLSLVWLLFGKKAKMPVSWGARLMPLAVAFVYYMGLWALCLALSGYSFGGVAWDAFVVATLPYFFPNLFFAFGGDFSLFPLMHVGVMAVSALVLILASRKRRPRAVMDRKAWVAIALAAAMCVLCALPYYQRSISILARDLSVEQVGAENEVNYYDYAPFRPGNSLVEMPFQPALAITGDYPRLDGATAAYPVYAAMAQGIYKGLSESTVGNYVECTTTSEAYRRLIAGETDIFFGAQPSQQQISDAKAAGLEFDMLPVAREAFVFFVNAQNTVSDLTLEQIRDIYTKKITNWRQLGGADEKILPFQRPENSGSQTIMQAVVMQGANLPAPLREEYAAGMGGVINQVASYRNYTSAIGYSFRFFATGMKPNDNIRLLAINGNEPTVDNIQNGSYPFTVDVYAVTARPKSENTQKLLDWLVSDQGQQLIELCGYVRR